MRFFDTRVLVLTGLLFFFGVAHARHLSRAFLLPVGAERLLNSSLDSHRLQFGKGERLRTQLKIRPDQQSAWEVFVKAMQPQAFEFYKDDTAPEALERWVKREQAHLQQQLIAVKTLYEVLTPSQRQWFDWWSCQRHYQGRSAAVCASLKPSAAIK